jgi:hypothetical protein
MKQRPLALTEAETLVRELRGMAMLPPGPAPVALRRAKEIRFLLTTQPGSDDYLIAKADEVQGLLETLLSARRWKATTPESLQKSIKSACDRLKVYVHRCYRRAGRAA